MHSSKDQTRAGLRLRGLIFFCLGIPLAGCAAITQDVDDYYRQMAVNYEEAIEKAKVEELTVKNQARVLAVTGDPRAHKYERELEKIRDWEKRCAHEQERFEKAAKWMETHFKHIEPSIKMSSHADAPPDIAGGDTRKEKPVPDVREATDE